MAEINNAVLLIGSPKRFSSSSASLGQYFLEGLKKNNIETSKLHIHSVLKNLDKKKKMLLDIEKADLIILSFPLYVDTLPAKVIELLSILDDNEKFVNSAENKFIIAISNSGFPESSQNEIALTVVKNFAEKTGVKWLGGIAVGMGASIAGRPLKELGSMFKDLTLGLELAAADTAKAEMISKEALDKLNKPLISQKWLYLLIGNVGWIIDAFKNKVVTKLNNKPYMK